jgi:hypothetical protein
MPGSTGVRGAPTRPVSSQPHSHAPHHASLAASGWEPSA